MAFTQHSAQMMSCSVSYSIMEFLWH